MEPYTVLICDDNDSIHNSLRPYLEGEGFRVLSVYTGEDALESLRRQSVHILILDVMLPGINGYEVCREIRKTMDTYIIMLSAKGEEIDKIVGLEVGADDYVEKPFSPRVVAIRARKAINRLHPKRTRKVLTLAELTV